ncbi:MAG: CBU_0592 family membrane protein [Bacteroidota bacterium]
MNITDITGTFGVFLILLAYFLLVTKKLHRDSLVYLLMNTFGAGLACIASIMLNYWPFIILEGAWTGVSVYAIWKILKTG